MNGISALTGQPLDDQAHLRQSIGDILTTPIGTRTMRREYGSLVFELIDQPFNAVTRIRLFAATAQALMRWEPRIRLTNVAFAQGEGPGAFVVDLEGVRTDVPEPAAYTRLTLPLRLDGQRRTLLAA